jgi:hypothetical protein
VQYILHLVKYILQLVQYILHFPSFPIQTTIKIRTFFEHMSPYAISGSLFKWR